MTQIPLQTARAVGEAILAAPQRPMDDQTSKMLLQLIVAGDGFSLPTEESRLPFFVQIAKKRVSAFHVPATDAVLLMLAVLSNSPGTVVLYCAALKALADRLGRAATITDLCEAFPMGFPDEKTLADIWDRQKARNAGPTDNWLDRAEAWQISHQP